MMTVWPAKSKRAFIWVPRWIKRGRTRPSAPRHLVREQVQATRFTTGHCPAPSTLTYNAVVASRLFMAIPANLEPAAQGERRRSGLAWFYLEHERLAIGGGTLVAVLLVWEVLGRSGLV